MAAGEKSGDLDKTQTIRLSPQLSQLREGERRAVVRLLEVGDIFQTLYEHQRHPQARSSDRDLRQLDERLNSPAATQNLLALYRLNQGPIATTLENKRERFCPSKRPRRENGPSGISKEELETFLAAHPEKRESILDLRTVVRRASAESLRLDVATLARHPALATLHPGLLQALERQLSQPDPKSFYAVPYSVAYADELVRAPALLTRPPTAVGRRTRSSRYRRNRGPRPSSTTTNQATPPG